MEEKANSLPGWVMIEVYVVRNTTPAGGGKTYVGQTQSHVLNRGKYRPFGHLKRWQSHVSEARSEPKKQSRKLNNAIRKYGTESFQVRLLGIFEPIRGDLAEEIFIKIFNSVSNGYNIQLGGSAPRLTIEQRKRISASLKAHYSDTAVCRQHSITHVKSNDHKKIAKFQAKPVTNITFGIYAGDGLVYFLVRTAGPGKRDRVTFRGKHVTREEAVSRAMAVALAIVQGDTSRLIVPAPLTNTFQLPIGETQQETG